MKQKLSKIKNFLLDLDGTTYLGDSLLPGAKDFINSLKKSGKSYIFFSNNSSKSSKNYLAKLRKLGLPCELENVLTSGDATMLYLKKRGFKKIYLLGTPELEKDFRSNGFILTGNNPHCVVLGFDKTLTYEKIDKAYQLIIKGKPFIATHPDVLCPVEEGFLLDIGAMIEMFKTATGGISPIVVGKPQTLMVKMALSRLKGRASETAMVGDRLYTDIAMGKNAKVTSILVLSGETKLSDLKKSKIKPDYMVKNLGELLAYVKREA